MIREHLIEIFTPTDFQLSLYERLWVTNYLVALERSTFWDDNKSNEIKLNQILFFYE